MVIKIKGNQVNIGMTEKTSKEVAGEWMNSISLDKQDGGSGQTEYTYRMTRVLY